MDARLSTSMILAGAMAMAGCDPAAAPDAAPDAANAPTDLSHLPAPEGEAPAKADDPEKTAAAADVVARLPHPDRPYPTPADARAACRIACNTDGRSDDDRATCRLGCADTESDLPARVVRRYLDCSSQCDPDDAACGSECRDALRAVGRAEMSFDFFCASVCLDTLARCGTECAGPSRDDRATCALHCEQDGARCLRECDQRATEADKAAANPSSPEALRAIVARLGSDAAGEDARRLVDDAARELGTMLVEIRGSPTGADQAELDRRLVELSRTVGEGVIVASGKLSPEARHALDEYGDAKLTVPLTNVVRELGRARD